MNIENVYSNLRPGNQGENVGTDIQESFQDGDLNFEHDGYTTPGTVELIMEAWREERKMLLDFWEDYKDAINGFAHISVEYRHQPYGSQGRLAGIHEAGIEDVYQFTVLPLKDGSVLAKTQVIISRDIAGIETGSVRLGNDYEFQIARTDEGWVVLRDTLEHRKTKEDALQAFGNCLEVVEALTVQSGFFATSSISAQS